MQDRLDRFCGFLGGFIPVGIIVGNGGYETMIALVGLCWITRSFLARENPFPWLLSDTPALPWLLLVASILLSLSVNGPGEKGIVHDILYIRHFLFICAIFDISRRISLKKYFLMGMASSVILAGLNIILAHSIGMDLMGKPAIRYTSRLKEATRIAGLFSFLAPALIAWSISLPFLSRRIKLAMFFLGVASTLMILQMGVRVALLSTFMGFCFWIIYILYRRFAFKALPYIIPIVILTSCLIAFYLSQQNLESIHHRISMYKTTWALILDHPFLGVGVSGFQDAYKTMAASGKVDPFIAPDGTVWQELGASHAHSLVLMILSCTGIVGFVVFIWLFFKIVHIAFTQSEPHFRCGLILWPLIFLINGLTGWSFYANWYHSLFAYLVALTWVVKPVYNLPDFTVCNSINPV